MSKSFSQKPLPGERFILHGPENMALRADLNRDPFLEIRNLCSPCEEEALNGRDRLPACDQCESVSGTLGDPNLMATLEDWLTDACENPLTASIMVSDLRLRLKHSQGSYSTILKVQAKKAGRSARKSRKDGARLRGNFTVDARAAQRKKQLRTLSVRVAG